MLGVQVGLPSVGSPSPACWKGVLQKKQLCVEAAHHKHIGASDILLVLLLLLLLLLRMTKFGSEKGNPNACLHEGMACWQVVLAVSLSSRFHGYEK